MNESSHVRTTQEEVVKPFRYAFVSDMGITQELLTKYLPENYQVAGKVTALADSELAGMSGFLVTGVDNAGWTLDGYVLPRLASGLIGAREVSPETAQLMQWELSHPVVNGRGLNI